MEKQHHPHLSLREISRSCGIVCYMLEHHSMPEEVYGLASAIFVSSDVNPVGWDVDLIDALNRYPCKSSNESDENENQKTAVILKYIFPRQFGLHNVFTSKVDRQETVHPFKDYTLREDEINGPLKPTDNSTKIPKRLRGTAIELTEKLRKLHDRCPYYELLKHYCVSLEAHQLNRDC